MQYEKPYMSDNIKMYYFNSVGTASIKSYLCHFLDSERVLWSLDTTFVVHVQCSLPFNTQLSPFEEEGLDCVASCLAAFGVRLRWAKRVIYINWKKSVTLAEVGQVQEEKYTRQASSVRNVQQ